MSTDPAPAGSTPPISPRQHALATALLGVVLGGYIAAHRVVDPEGPGNLVLLILLVVAVMAIGAWQVMAGAVGTPKARRTGLLGLLASAVVAAFVSNAADQGGTIPPLAVLMTGAAVAAPAAIAAWFILRPPNVTRRPTSTP